MATRDARGSFAARPLFVAVIALSSFLLFTLELLAGRLVLPAFGGAPAVWTTTLCFFTAAVFIGYLYAHLSVTRLGSRRGGIPHIVLAAVAVLAAALAPRDVASLRLEGVPEALNVLLVLTVIVGAPAFLLSTTSPLLSAWFSERGRDPWWLYAASNAASLGGLLAYPFLIEPNVPLSAQRMALTAGLGILAVALAVVVGVGRRVGQPREAHDPPAPSPAPGLRRQAIWLLAAAVPAGLLSATTTYLATDYISAPLLWIGPLGIYLGSFVVAFSERGRRVLPVVDRLVPAAATLMWVLYLVPPVMPVAVVMLVVLGSFAILAVSIHGHLALDRPDGAHLTRFYLVLSAAGLVATSFVALVAPVVFNGVYEYPILIVAGLFALRGLPPKAASRTPGAAALLLRAAVRLLPLAAVGAVLVASAASVSEVAAQGTTFVLVIGAMTVLFADEPRMLASGTLVAVVALSVFFAQRQPALARVRTFFGVTEVRVSPDGAARSEIHGTTVHGVQYTDSRKTLPVAYYVKAGPVGDMMSDLRRRASDDARIGVVGLGIGTLAVYTRAGDSLTFFEIDKAVIDLAEDERYFTYLKDAKGDLDIVLGDGRLSLAEQPPGSFDLLVLDAFSSDAVPAHLLTREAMQVYLRTLRPGGVLVFHVSNRHFDLAPAVAATARSLGLDVRSRLYEPEPDAVERLGAVPTAWVVAGRTTDLAGYAGDGWTDPPEGPVLTDDLADVLRLLRPR